MLQLLLELVIAPALVAVSTLASRRWGTRIGGALSAFPAIAGPVLLIVAHDRGAAAAERAATGTLLGLTALSGFALVYARASRRAAWPTSLAVGWIAAALLEALIGAGGIPTGLATGLTAAAGSLLIAYRALPQAARPAPQLPIGPGRLLLRMASTSLLIGLLALAARRFGPLVGGMLTALPVLASLLAVFTHRQAGADAATELLRGMLAGMAAFVSFCAVVALLVVPIGIVAAFAIALLAALAMQALSLDPVSAGLSRAFARKRPLGETR